MVCDFPDLYDYDAVNVGNGIGHYSLMCFGGPDKNPTQVEAYLKHAAGWASRVTTLAGGTTATVEAGRNDFLIHARNAAEYFIIENRQQSGRDAALPDAGLAIWHVDVNGNNSNEQMTAASTTSVPSNRPTTGSTLNAGSTAATLRTCTAGRRPRSALQQPRPATGGTAAPPAWTLSRSPPWAPP